jgi:hypothetical protein
VLALPQERPARNVRVGSIVIRCSRFDEMRVFWQAALGYVPREAPQDGWVVLTDPNGTGPNFSLERVETSIAPAPDELSAIHLDLYTEDQKGEVERLVALGATPYGRETPDGADFVVLVDPGGYRFCVVQK